MVAVYSKLDERLIKFIAGQPMFFVATAPCLDDSGAGGACQRLTQKVPRQNGIITTADPSPGKEGGELRPARVFGHDLLDRWAERKSADDLAAYRVKHNSASIDGLPALG